MSSYVLSFRSRRDHRPSEEEEKAWMTWFETIGSSITDFGHRVSPGRTLGATPSADDVLSGYVVISAESLADAERVASGCPGLASGGTVELGPAIEPGS
jgi:hypothetical protein